LTVSTPVEVTRDEARRIAVRAQLLDGRARDVLDTVRRLGFLQLDPISTVAPPQHLVLFSRLGRAYDQAELDRLLWDEKQLFEWARTSGRSKRSRSSAPGCAGGTAGSTPTSAEAPSS
jgi:uncharacterized protein YcaQ